MLITEVGSNELLKERATAAS